MPGEPGVDGAERELAALRAPARAGNRIEQPRELGAAEIRIEHQAGLAAHQLFGAALFQLGAFRRGAPVLPDDRVGERLAALAIPQQRGLALVGDADRGDLLRIHARLRDRLARAGELRGEDLARVVLDPARLRVDLAELVLRGGRRRAVFVEQDRARAGGSLVECEDVAHAGILSRRSVYSRGGVDCGVYRRGTIVLEADEELDQAMRQSQRLARDRSRRMGWVGAIAASYLADAVFLALFCVAGTIPMRVPVAFGAGAATIVGLHYWAYASGWNLKFRDPNLVVPLMVASFAMQLGVFALAPQLAFPLLANLFTVFAFGVIWLTVRASVVVWAVGSGLTGIVLFAVAERAGMPTGTLFERTLVWLFFTLILGRFVLLSANATAMRTRLYDSRRKLAQSLAQVQELVRFDELTKTLNRRSLIERLEEERSRAERAGSPFSVALLDLDHFKGNDT